MVGNVVDNFFSYLDTMSTAHFSNTNQIVLKISKNFENLNLKQITIKSRIYLKNTTKLCCLHFFYICRFKIVLYICKFIFHTLKYDVNFLKNYHATNYYMSAPCVMMYLGQ